MTPNTCRQTLIYCVLLALLGCSGSSDPTSQDSYELKTTTSFGECLGYCNRTLTLNAATITYSKQGNTPATPDQEYSMATDPATWACIRALLDQVNRDFQDLPEVIGCPDCLDGGAESLEISDGVQSHKTRFDYNNSPAVINQLMDRLRTLPAIFEMETLGYWEVVDHTPGAPNFSGLRVNPNGTGVIYFTNGETSRERIGRRYTIEGEPFQLVTESLGTLFIEELTEDEMRVQVGDLVYKVYTLRRRDPCQGSD